MRIFSRIVEWMATPYTIYLVFKDPAISQSVKLRSIIVLILLFAYIVSPIDVIPDFIPFAGWLDDLLVIPFGMALIRKITPNYDVLEKREKAQVKIRRTLIWTIFALAIAMFLMLACLALLIYLIVRRTTG